MQPHKPANPSLPPPPGTGFFPTFSATLPSPWCVLRSGSAAAASPLPPCFPLLVTFGLKNFPPSHLTSPFPYRCVSSHCAPPPMPWVPGIRKCRRRLCFTPFPPKVAPHSLGRLPGMGCVAASGLPVGVTGTATGRAFLQVPDLPFWDHQGRPRPWALRGAVCGGRAGRPALPSRECDVPRLSPTSAPTPHTEPHLDPSNWRSFHSIAFCFCFPGGWRRQRVPSRAFRAHPLLPFVVLLSEVVCCSPPLWMCDVCVPHFRTR